MAKIKYSMDAKGVLRAQADTFVNGRLVRIGVTGASVQGDTEKDAHAWGQLTFDLFSERDSIQNGASEPKGVK